MPCFTRAYRCVPQDDGETSDVGEGEGEGEEGSDEVTATNTCCAVTLSLYRTVGHER